MIRRVKVPTPTPHKHDIGIVYVRIILCNVVDGSLDGKKRGRERVRILCEKSAPHSSSRVVHDRHRRHQQHHRIV